MVSFNQTWTNLATAITTAASSIMDEVSDSTLTVEKGVWKFDFAVKQNEVLIDTPAAPAIIINAMREAPFLTENPAIPTAVIDVLIVLEPQPDSVTAVANLVTVADRVWKVIRKTLKTHNMNMFPLSTYSDSPRFVISFNVSYTES
jgi:hypothetical protein